MFIAIGMSTYGLGSQHSQHPLDQETQTNILSGRYPRAGTVTKTSGLVAGTGRTSRRAVKAGN